MWWTTIGTYAAAAINAVAPQRCAVCRKAAAGVCEGCVRVLTNLPEPAPHTLSEGWVRAAFPYISPLREVIQGGKYGDARSGLRIAAVLAAERLCVVDRPASLVPVPLGAARRRRRGYDQAELIAHVFGAALDVPVVRGVRRVRETASQVGRSPSARRLNVAGAFEWNGLSATGLVWVVDDVVTTGATMSAVMAAVRAGGATEVCGVALAEAGKHLA